MSTLKLGCSCGQIQGLANNVSPKKGNHLVCYCDDCQTFAHQLNQASSTLNNYGGTEIYQLPPSHIRIRAGADQLACLRLTAKGLHRWYAGCCNTPIGNTVSARIPFVGLIHTFIQEDKLNEKIGPVLGSVHKKFAVKPIPDACLGPASQAQLVCRVMGKLLIWKLTRQSQPNPFFDPQGISVSQSTIVAKEHEPKEPQQ